MAVALRDVVLRLGGKWQSGDWHYRLDRADVLVEGSGELTRDTRDAPEIREEATTTSPPMAARLKISAVALAVGPHRLALRCIEIRAMDWQCVTDGADVGFEGSCEAAHDIGMR